MKKQLIHQPICALTPLVAISALALSLSVCKGSTVFSDDFSEAPGTVINGKSADIGGIWEETSGTSLAISAANSVDTTGAGRFLFDTFTAPLGAGQQLTLNYDTLAVSGDNFFAGWAGVSLFESGNERVFTGNPSAGSWGVDRPEIGGQQASGDTTTVNSAVFSYAYDSGEWSFTTLSGVNLSGTGTAGMALDQLRIANGGGADINVDNVVVDISAVPEPASMVLLGLGGIGLVLYRRYRS